ncbi:MAG: hypothetical protein PWP18_406, partial [Thermoanaerobacter sp.]|nr:hypothetical protein [Thermoanaerobacter sp.]
MKPGNRHLYASGAKSCRLDYSNLRDERSGGLLGPLLI